MALNPHFDLYRTNTNEQTLVEDLYAEAITIYGQDVHYIIRNMENIDEIFNEDILSSFDTSYVIEMYLEDYEGFERNDFISNFGYQMQDRMTFGVSQNRFREETELDMPNEGDLIYLPLANALFEIKFVEDESIFYTVGTPASFKITTELFRYDNQTMDTGIPEIDQLAIERDLSEDGIDPFADNDVIETEAENIVNKNPDNPFGQW